MIEVHEILALVACFTISAFYSGSEAVLMSLGVDRARQLMESEGLKGKMMLFMVEHPNELLSTILVGNNLANIFAASFTTAIATRLFENDAVGISVGVTTIIILIFGEIIPKTFARTHSEKLAVFVILILRINYYLFFPIIFLLTAFIKKILGENAEITGRLVTKHDIEYLVNKAEKEKSMDSKQIELLSSILEFPTIKVRDIMIPRNKVKYIQSIWSFQEIISFAKIDNHSRYPVAKGDLDEVIGFLHVKDLAFVRSRDKENFKIENFLKTPFFVYEHMKIQAVFDHMNRKKVHLALVKDETGLITGIITLEDIIEEILGDIIDEHDHFEFLDPNENPLHKEGVEVEGQIQLRDLDNDFDIKIPPHDNYSTLAGFLLDILGDHFPKKDQFIVWNDLSFELTEVDEKTNSIEKVRVKTKNGEKHIFSKREAISANRSDSNENQGQSTDSAQYDKYNGAK